MALLLWLTPYAVQAQDATAEPLEETAVEVTADAAAVDPDQINEVARQLWCPLCSGVRLDACELKACSQMKDVIGQKLAEGTDVQTIKNYFVAQYGPQVLGEPPMEGFNWLAWILPVVAMIAGGYFVWSRTRKMVGRAPSDQLAPGNGASAQPEGGDDYSRKLDEELEHYD